MTRTKSLARRASSKVFKFFMACNCASSFMDDAVPAKPVSHTSNDWEPRRSSVFSSLTHRKPANSPDRATQSTITEANMVSRFSLDSSDFEDDEDYGDDDEEEEQEDEDEDEDEELDTSPATRVVLPVQPSDVPAPAPTANPWKHIRPKRDRPVGSAAAPPRSDLHKHIRRSRVLSTIFELLEPPSRRSRLPKRDLRREEERSDSFITGWEGLPPVTTTVDDGRESERRRDPWSYGPTVFALDWPR